MMMKTAATLLLLGGSNLPAGVTAGSVNTTPLTQRSGQTAAIPNWSFQSSVEIDKNFTELSLPGADTSTWHHVDISSCTLMGCLIQAGVYKTDELWFSDAMSKVNSSTFNVPWAYRNEFTLPKQRRGQHFLLETHGISSKADLYLNGHQFASSDFQSGAYGGHEYDITSLAQDTNALVVLAYNTSYTYDFGISFLDWNPAAPDHGTGIWRDINVRQVGSASLSPLSVSTDIGLPVEQNQALVTVYTTARNLENRTVNLLAECTILDPSGKESAIVKQRITLAAKETKEIQFTRTLRKPQIWWPKQWGSQPLYNAKVVLSADSTVSDVMQTNFGVRTVTSELNQHNDTRYFVNGHPFQVLGGGYGADMFLRWDAARFTTIATYVLDMGLNTIRLEGKMEHPELYDIADRLGLMVMPGWECCTKWEAWPYNTEDFSNPPIWNDNDYQTANSSMIHEAAILQPHPSILSYMVGSDYWPDDRATKIYVDALKAAHWQTPIISSAAKRGFPKLLGPSGLKMDGPYDWVPPNYWYDVDPSEDRLGAAFGFGSELGAGVGTPEIGSLRKFLSQADMDDLWQNPEKGLYHMSTSASKFHVRTTYNAGLFNRYGPPTSLDDYLMKAQLSDYEATRAQHEGYSTRWTADRPATGTIYWMLNNGWPSLHWNQFDYYFHPGGSFFGTKTGARVEHVAYDYAHKEIWLINHSLSQKGSRTIEAELIDLNGQALWSHNVTTDTETNSAKKVVDVDNMDKIKDVAFLRLQLTQGRKTLSRNVYWLGKQVDALNWANSTWYTTPVTDYVDYTALGTMKPANVTMRVGRVSGAPHLPGTKEWSVVLENHSEVAAFFISLNLVDAEGSDVTPVLWSDNYVTLWPHEKLTLTAAEWGSRGASIHVKGVNVKAVDVRLH